VQALLDDIQYANNSDNPSTLARTVTYTLNDGDGIANGGTNTGTATATINVTAVNDPPVEQQAGRAEPSTRTRRSSSIPATAT
jgi:hypothetical protein